MFKGLGSLGAIAGLLGNPGKIKEEMDKLNERMSRITAEGDAGAGMVTVAVNGKLEVLRCTLSEEVVKRGDREMLEDLVRSAMNQALEKARKLAAEETARMAADLGLPALPPGLLPGT